jgi:hypothetical protein
MRAPNRFPDRLTRPFRVPLCGLKKASLVSDRCGRLFSRLGGNSQRRGRPFCQKCLQSPSQVASVSLPEAEIVRTPTPSVDCLRISPGCGRCWREADMPPYRSDVRFPAHSGRDRGVDGTADSDSFQTSTGAEAIRKKVDDGFIESLVKRSAVKT